VAFNQRSGVGFFQRIPVPETPADPPRVTDVDIVNGCCMMVRSEVFRRIGLIDSRYFIYHEESDFCLRALEAGYKCGVMAEGLVWHKGSSVFKRSGKRFQRYYDARNLGLLLSKNAVRVNGRRGHLVSYAEWLRYAYHRYCHEREEGLRESADAVLEGLIDVATRKFGRYQPRQRWPLPVLRFLFEGARKIKPASRTFSPAEEAGRPI
jgi:GT2 family glycosyltransferase